MEQVAFEKWPLFYTSKNRRKDNVKWKEQCELSTFRV